MPATRSRDHVKRGVAKFTELFRDKPVLEAMLASALRKLQDTEDALWEVITERYHPTGMDGARQLGAIVGRGQGSISDLQTYLRFINAQILANRSGGQLPILLRIHNIVTEGAPVNVLEAYPAAMLWEYFSVVDPLQVFLLLRMAKAGGVRLVLTYSDAPGEDGDFQLSDDYLASETDETKGFGWDETPELGGRLRGDFP